MHSSTPVEERNHWHWDGDDVRKPLAWRNGSWKAKLVSPTGNVTVRIFLRFSKLLHWRKTFRNPFFVSPANGILICVENHSEDQRLAAQSRWHLLLHPQQICGQTNRCKSATYASILIQSKSSLLDFASVAVNPKTLQFPLHHVSSSCWSQSDNQQNTLKASFSRYNGNSSIRFSTVSHCFRYRKTYYINFSTSFIQDSRKRHDEKEEQTKKKDTQNNNHAYRRCRSTGPRKWGCSPAHYIYFAMRQRLLKMTISPKARLFCHTGHSLGPFFPSHSYTAQIIRSF